jgi:hypothetical protein
MGERLFCRAVNLGQVNVQKLAMALPETAGNHDRVDMGALGRMDDGSDRMIRREQVDVVGPNQDKVRILARREAARSVLQSGASRAVDRRGFEARSHRDRERSGFVARTRVGWCSD